MLRLKTSTHSNRTKPNISFGYTSATAPGVSERPTGITWTATAGSKVGFWIVITCPCPPIAYSLTAILGDAKFSREFSLAENVLALNFSQATPGFGCFFHRTDPFNILAEPMILRTLMISMATLLSSLPKDKLNSHSRSTLSCRLSKN